MPWRVPDLRLCSLSANLAVSRRYFTCFLRFLTEESVKAIKDLTCRRTLPSSGDPAQIPRSHDGRRGPQVRGLQPPLSSQDRRSDGLPSLAGHAARAAGLARRAGRPRADDVPRHPVRPGELHQPGVHGQRRRRERHAPAPARLHPVPAGAADPHPRPARAGRPGPGPEHHREQLPGQPGRRADLLGVLRPAVLRPAAVGAGGRQDPDHAGRPEPFRAGRGDPVAHRRDRRRGRRAGRLDPGPSPRTASTSTW